MKSTTSTSTILGAIEDAAAVVADLLDEMTTWRDNMSSANMEHLPKYDEVNETVDLLEAADMESRADSLRDAVEQLAEGRAFVAGCPEHVEGQRCKRCKWDGVPAPLVEIAPLVEFYPPKESDWTDTLTVASLLHGTCTSTWTVVHGAAPETIAYEREQARRRWWKEATELARRNDNRLGHRLEDIPELPPFPGLEDIEEKTVTFSVTKKRRMSRAARLDEGTTMLEAALAALHAIVDGIDDPEDRLSELQPAMDDLQESLDELSNVCFPGMFG